ncbi:hypothetical protein Dsin_021467 [Dipteronia sinensis]|uniref:Uncharacterized protein n=1 Tax=Dipteronia sinensis TaxID=43782 RepID=A0AAE0A0Q9_9ROSI|nr:hypothetical protein Dsin_021467 [Dipteronia sinensis]
MAEIVNPSIEGAGTPSEGTNPPLWKGRYSSDVAVRRSASLQDVVVPIHFQEIESLIEEVALSESEKEDELPTNEETEINQSDSTMSDTNLGEKIDYLVGLLNEQRKSIETLELLATKRSMSGEIPCSSQTRYKNLYFKSQKKVEALTEENRQLAMKLEIAVAKLERYEKGTRANSDMMEKLKGVILVSNLTLAAQNAVNTLQDKARVSSVRTRKIREIKKK